MHNKVKEVINQKTKQNNRPHTKKEAEKINKQNVHIYMCMSVCLKNHMNRREKKGREKEEG